MLSTLLSSDGFFGTPFPAFEPWDFQEPPLSFQQDEPVFSPDPTQEPIFSNSGSDNSEPMPISSNSGSKEENRKRKSSNSGSDDPTVVDDERKRIRRMISNRESARRSRMRKQKHMEDLRNEVNRLKFENRDMMNQLRLFTHHSQILQTENELLRSKSVMLQQKLWDMHQDLVVRQLEQQLSSSLAMQ